MPLFDRRTNHFQHNPEFLHSILIENCQRMRPIFTTVMVVEAIIFIFEFLFYERTPVMVTAMALKLVAVFLSIFSICQFHRIRIGNDPAKYSRNLKIIYAIIGLALSWAVANTAVAQMITGDITVYVLVLFGIAAVVQMPPRHAMAIYCLFYLFFIAVVPMVQNNPRIVTWHVINGGILNVIAWLISRMIYQYRLEIYKDKTIIGQKNKELFDKAQQDGLTGLFNHQAIHGHLDKALSFADGNRQDLSIALIDIDHFKCVNDTYGHQTGDVIVKGVADTIRRSVREMDITGRYGGDEFLIIFPDCSVKNARRIIERLQKNLNGLNDQVPSLTISCGIAQRDGEGANALVEMADRLLYRAKASGRNRIEA